MPGSWFKVKTRGRWLGTAHQHRAGIPLRREGPGLSVPAMNPEPSGFRLGDLAQVAVTISDLDRAVAFYRDTLGLKHLFSAPPGLAFFACGNVRLMLSRPESPGGERFNPALYFRVPSINEAHQALRGRGVSFDSTPHLVARMPDHELWLAFFRDPDRNLLALMSEPKV